MSAEDPAGLITTCVIALPVPLPDNPLSVNDLCARDTMQ
jgi:hypothetical protein